MFDAWVICLVRFYGGGMTLTICVGIYILLGKENYRKGIQFFVFLAHNGSIQWELTCNIMRVHIRRGFIYFEACMKLFSFTMALCLHSVRICDHLDLVVLHGLPNCCSLPYITCSVNLPFFHKGIYFCWIYLFIF